MNVDDSNIDNGLQWLLLDDLQSALQNPWIFWDKSTNKLNETFELKPHVIANLRCSFTSIVSKNPRETMLSKTNLLQQTLVYFSPQEISKKHKSWMNEESFSSNLIYLLEKHEFQSCFCSYNYIIKFVFVDFGKWLHLGAHSNLSIIWVCH